MLSVVDRWRDGKRDWRREPLALRPERRAQRLPQLWPVPVLEIHVFKAFKSAIPFMWVEDRSLWYRPREDLTWAVFLPVLVKMNEQRKKLLAGLLLLLLDESMSGWRPKTSAKGGLPSISFEPRKPVSLGTMLRNGADPESGDTDDDMPALELI